MNFILKLIYGNLNPKYFKEYQEIDCVSILSSLIYFSVATLILGIYPNKLLEAISFSVSIFSAGIL